MNTIKIVAFSDNHWFLPIRDFELPSGDLLIVAGDGTSNGSERQFLELFETLGKLKYEDIIYVPGNHDKWIYENQELAIETAKNYNITILIDSTISSQGIIIYGSPWSPLFNNWYFMRSEKELKIIYENIINCDILITHTPPHKILDNDDYGGVLGKFGSKKLLSVLKKKTVNLHLFGHIHKQGIIYNDKLNRYSCNISICNFNKEEGELHATYHNKYNPTEIIYDKKKKKVMSIKQ
jgi:Icc-related predicted phosphoesterase